MRIWKKTLMILLDVLLAVYLIFAVTSFNQPDVSAKVCKKVPIDIQDENTNGFLNKEELRHLLEKKKIYPLEKPVCEINPRKVEELLKSSPFVQSAECYLMQNGHVNIEITQRLPIVRIKSEEGDDYYLDDNGGILPHSHYTSDLIVATGHISRAFAASYLPKVATWIMGHELWKDQIVQINVLHDLGIELVPRVGEHVVFLGYLPELRKKERHREQVEKFLAAKLDRLMKFYQYGLSKVGWNKYSYINLEFDNQIICKKNKNI